MVLMMVLKNLRLLFILKHQKVLTNKHQYHMPPKNPIIICLCMMSMHLDHTWVRVKVQFFPVEKEMDLQTINGTQHVWLGQKVLVMLFHGLMVKSMSEVKKVVLIYQKICHRVGHLSLGKNRIKLEMVLLVGKRTKVRWHGSMCILRMPPPMNVVPLVHG